MFYPAWKYIQFPLIFPHCTLQVMLFHYRRLKGSCLPLCSDRVEIASKHHTLRSSFSISLQDRVTWPPWGQFMQFLHSSRSTIPFIESNILTGAFFCFQSLHSDSPGPVVRQTCFCSLFLPCRQHLPKQIGVCYLQASSKYASRSPLKLLRFNSLWLESIRRISSEGRKLEVWKKIIFWCRLCRESL